MADQKVKLKRFNGTEQEVLHPETDYDQIVNKPTTFTPSAHSLNSHTDVNASPTDGQVLTWDNTNSLWIAGDGGGGSATVTISATEPTSPAVGDLWWDSSEGNLYIYYDDGSSTQWVEASGSVSAVVNKSDLQNLYIYGKASVAITKGQAIQFAGVQGDHILMKPAVQSEINANPDYLIGIAESNLAINDFGYVVVSGRLTLDTTAYDAGNILYYDSAGSTAGALTTTEPTGGTAIIQMAAVSVDGVDNGEFIVRTLLLSREIHEIIGLQGELDDKSDVGHTHDDRYYTETETDTLLSGKSDTGHTHTFSSLTSKPTTLSGYGITDGVSTTSSQALDATDAISIVGNILYLNKANGTSETIDLSIYLDDTNLARIVSGVYVPATQVLRFTRDDASTFDIDASMFFDDTNLVTSVSGGSGISVNQTTGAITVTNTAPDQTVTITGGGATTVSGTYPNFTISSTDNNTVYTHPTYPGDDIDLDTGPLTGATVISDLDFNITSDTLGHITDANATYSTRTLTANDLGATRFYNDAYLNSSTDTASFISELINDYGCFQNNNVVLKIAWSYAGNSDLNTGHPTIGTIELAGCTIETWGAGNKHIRITRPTTGTGGVGVYEYNDQGSSYSPGWREIWTSESDGSGSGLDADLLDGNHASAFYLATNPSGYTTNTGTVTSVATGGGLTGGTITTSGTISHADTSSQASVNNSGATVIQDVTLDTYGHTTGLGSVTITPELIGAQPAGSYAPSSHTHNELNERTTITYGGSYLQWADVYGTGGAGTNGAEPTNPYNEWFHHLIMNHANSAGYYVDIAAGFHQDYIGFRRNVGGSLQSWRELIHSGNIGSQSVNYANSAGNADTVDGFHASQTAGSANTAVVRNSSGYIMNTWFNSSRSNETSAAASYIYDTGDGYMRKKTLANAQAEIVTSAAVTSGLGYTPYNSTNPNGYTSNTGTVTSVTSGDSYILMGGSATAPTVNISSTTGSYLVPLVSNASTTRVTTTSYVDRASATLTGNRTYKITVAGTYTVSYGGTNFIPYMGLFFSSTTYVTVQGVISTSKVTSGTGAYETPIYTASTMATGSTGASTATAYFTGTSSATYPFFLEATVGVGPNTPTVYLGGKISAAGGGGGFQFGSGTRMVIQRIS